MPFRKNESVFCEMHNKEIKIISNLDAHLHRHHNKDKLIGSEKYETMINTTLNEHNNNDTLEFEEFEEFEHSHKI